MSSKSDVKSGEKNNETETSTLWETLKFKKATPGVVKINTSALQKPIEPPTVISHTKTVASSPQKYSEYNYQEVADDSKIKSIEKVLKADKIDIKALKEVAWTGVPSKYRAETWKLLLGYMPVVRDRQQMTIERKRKEYLECIPRYYDTKDVEGTDLDRTTYRQIDVDMPRTAPDIPLFHEEEIQNRLKRLLYIWAIRHPGSGYVQGINDICTPFIIVFLSSYTKDPYSVDVYSLPKVVLDEVEADTYWCLSRLLDGIHDHYTFDQPGIQKMMRLLEEITQSVDEELDEHLQSEGLQYMQFAFRWMNCLLIREFSLQTVIRLWDTYLSEENGFDTYHVYVCACYLKQGRDQLLSMDFQSMLLYLQNPSKEWDTEKTEDLLSQAFILKSTFGKTH
ncbi:hypothetical protein WA158_006870 [Blastocystis sp. Blastoise]